MNRRKEREQAFVLIFEKSFRDDETVENILEDALSSDFYESSEYSEKIFTGTVSNLDEIDGIIKDNLKGWKIDRISKVSLSILRLAIYEIRYVTSVPSGVSINEAVELSKKYATVEDTSFINGVLGSVARSE